MATRDETALGLVETHGLIAALEAADAMAKAADVRLVAVEQTVPAMMTVQVVGEVAAVQAAVDAGRVAAERVGRVAAAHVIPRPDADTRTMLELDAPEAKATAPSPAPKKTSSKKKKAAPAAAPAATPATQDLDSLTVRQLRDLARQQEDFPLRGRAIARASRAELLSHLRVSS